MHGKIDACLGVVGPCLQSQHLGSWSLRPAMSLRSCGAQRVWHWPWACWSRVGLWGVPNRDCEGWEEPGCFYHHCCSGHGCLISEFSMSGFPAEASYCSVNISIKAGFLNGWKVALMYLSVRALIFVLQPFSIDVFFNQSTMWCYL